METYEFTIVIERDENGRFVAICSTLQGCYAEGESEDEAREAIREAIQAHVESRRERGEPIYAEVFSENIAFAG